MAVEVKKEYDGKIGQTTGVPTEERLKGIKNEIMIVKLAVAAGGQAPLRTPPGYGGQEGDGAHPPPAPHPGVRETQRCYVGSAAAGGFCDGAPEDRRGTGNQENQSVHRAAGGCCDGAPKDRCGEGNQENKKNQENHPTPRDDPEMLAEMLPEMSLPNATAAT